MNREAKAYIKTLNGDACEAEVVQPIELYLRLPGFPHAGPIRIEMANIKEITIKFTDNENPNKPIPSGR